MAQHDVDILDDHRISIFDNRAYYRADAGWVDGASDVVIYDFQTDAITRPIADAFTREGMKVLFEGLHDHLPGGGMVIEDQASGRLVVLGADGARLGQFVNLGEDGNVYQIGWGRYVDEAQGNAILSKLKEVNCED
jgi:hypothetical protein